LLLRQDAKTRHERVHDQTANSRHPPPCIIYLNHEWNAALHSILSLGSPVLTIARRIARLKCKCATLPPPAGKRLRN